MAPSASEEVASGLAVDGSGRTGRRERRAGSGGKDRTRTGSRPGRALAVRPVNSFFPTKSRIVDGKVRAHESFSGKVRAYVKV